MNELTIALKFWLVSKKQPAAQITTTSAQFNDFVWLVCFFAKSLSSSVSLIFRLTDLNDTSQGIL